MKSPNMTSPRRALLVVAKKPAPGQTKTRLSPPLTSEQAAALYECFLRDTLDVMRAAAREIGLTLIIAYLPAGEEAYFHAIAPDFKLLLQQGDNLSERLYHATTHCLLNGYDQAAIMDSDSPTLPVSSVVAAFTSLDDADVSLGPVDDGGYYMIGVKKAIPTLFLNVTMSTDHVAIDTLAQAEAVGLRVALLPGCYDIDYAGELKRLIAELSQLPAEIAAHTRAYLDLHGESLFL